VEAASASAAISNIVFFLSSAIFPIARILVLTPCNAAGHSVEGGVLAS
jgi:hypothetical protein